MSRSGAPYSTAYATGLVVVVIEGDDHASRVAATEEALEEYARACGKNQTTDDKIELLVERFEGSESLDIALSAASTPSITGQPRAIVVQCKAIDVADVERIARWLSGEGYTEPPLEALAIVVIGCERVPSQEARRLMQESGVRLKKAVRPSYSDLPRLVAQLAQGAGLDLAPDAAAFLGSVVGGDIPALKGALAQLADAYQSGDAKHRLGVAEIQRIFNPARHDPPWVLIQAVERGDVATALMSLEGFLDGDYHPLQVLSMLYTSCRRIAYLAMAPALHKELLASMKLPPSAKSRISALARRLGPSGSIQMLEALALAELDMKGRSGHDPRLILEKLVVSLCESMTAARRQGTSAAGRKAASARSGNSP